FGYKRSDVKLTDHQIVSTPVWREGHSSPVSELDNPLGVRGHRDDWVITEPLAQRDDRQRSVLAEIGQGLARNDLERFRARPPASTPRKLFRFRAPQLLLHESRSFARQPIEVASSSFVLDLGGFPS